MKIKDCTGFQLDADKIELHSLDERNIRLPYSGPLPDDLADNDGVAISVVLRVGLSVNVCLEVKRGKEKSRYPVDCTAQEVNDLLFSFFFQDDGNNSFPTRWDCGLSRYWLQGFYPPDAGGFRRFHAGERK